MVSSGSVRTIQGRVDRTDPVLISLCSSSVVTIASEPVSIDYDRSFEKNRDVDVDSMLHGHAD